MILSVIIGFLSGIISGMGIGGGAVLIPFLVFILRTPQKVAQGVNLAYFLPTAIIALIIHLKNKNIDVKSGLITGICGIIGAIPGSLIAMRLQNPTLKKMFGFFLLFIGIKEVVKGIKIKKRLNR